MSVGRAVLKFAADAEQILSAAEATKKALESVRKKTKDATEETKKFSVAGKVAGSILTGVLATAATRFARDVAVSTKGVEGLGNKGRVAMDLLGKRTASARRQIVTLSRDFGATANSISKSHKLFASGSATATAASALWNKTLRRSDKLAADLTKGTQGFAESVKQSGKQSKVAQEIMEKSGKTAKATAVQVGSLATHLKKTASNSDLLRKGTVTLNKGVEQAGKNTKLYGTRLASLSTFLRGTAKSSDNLRKGSEVLNKTNQKTQAGFRSLSGFLRSTTKSSNALGKSKQALGKGMRATTTSAKGTAGAINKVTRQMGPLYDITGASIATLGRSFSILFHGFEAIKVGSAKLFGPLGKLNARLVHMGTASLAAGAAAGALGGAAGGAATLLNTLGGVSLGLAVAINVVIAGIGALVAAIGGKLTRVSQYWLSLAAELQEANFSLEVAAKQYAHTTGETVESVEHLVEGMRDLSTQTGFSFSALKNHTAALLDFAGSIDLPIEKTEQFGYGVSDIVPRVAALAIAFGKDFSFVFQQFLSEIANGAGSLLDFGVRIEAADILQTKYAKSITSTGRALTSKEKGPFES